MLNKLVHDLMYIVKLPDFLLLNVYTKSGHLTCLQPLQARCRGAGRPGGGGRDRAGPNPAPSA